MDIEHKKYLEDLKVLGEDESLYLVIDGYKCKIKRQYHKCLCGYVNVPIKRDLSVDRMVER